MRRFRISGKRTIIASSERAIVLQLATAPKQLPVDSYQALPSFDANDKTIVWIENGQLYREGEDPIYIGNVLRRQTLFWVGSHFGFGFYQTNGYCVAFTFPTDSSGFNDSVSIPPLRGQLIDSTCSFTKTRAWFFSSFQTGGKTINRCIVIKDSGQVEALAEAEEGDGSWLGTIRGKCCFPNQSGGSFLLAPTDDGVVRVEVANGSLAVTDVYPDTEPFVDSSCELVAGDSLYVIDYPKREIRALQIA